MGTGLAVWESAINLPLLQRGRVAFVLYADHETGTCGLGTAWLRCGFALRYWHVSLTQKALDFELASSKTMGFVPVKLRVVECIIREANCRDSFESTPAAFAIELA
jgi:hypothetical protein